MLAHLSGHTMLVPTRIFFAMEGGGSLNLEAQCDEDVYNFFFMEGRQMGEKVFR